MEPTQPTKKDRFEKKRFQQETSGVRTRVDPDVYEKNLSQIVFKACQAWERRNQGRIPFKD